MYWIYLITFTFMVFVPTLIKDNFGFLSLNQSQEIVSLLLGLICFALFLLQEKNVKKHSRENYMHQAQASRMAKDLKNVYSYIGEMNRKLDILENIALNYPKNSNLTRKNEQELYAPIMSAIELFGKTDEFVLCFVDLIKNKLLLEFKNKPESLLGFSRENFNRNFSYRELEDVIIINSPSDIDNIAVCVFLKKKNTSHKIEDMEMMKALAAQALMLFVFLQNNRYRVKNN